MAVRIEQWRLEPAGGGAVRILARHSGQALDVYGASVDDVTPDHSVPAGAWRRQPGVDAEPHRRLTCAWSPTQRQGDGRRTLASVDDGARVIQYHPHGDADQQWLLRAIDTSAP